MAVTGSRSLLPVTFRPSNQPKYIPKTYNARGADHLLPFFIGQMKQAFFILWLTALCASVSLSKPQTPPTKKAVPKKAATTKAPAGKTTTTKKAPLRSAARSTKKGTLPRTPVRVRQMTPSADRYREIQESLVAKGYLQQEPTGVWDTKSSDALRQFQTETDLTPTGKLSSLTLIRLGLGPKFSDAPVVIPPVTEPQPQP